jgi:hypothetical protein
MQHQSRLMWGATISTLVLLVCQLPPHPPLFGQPINQLHHLLIGSAVGVPERLGRGYWRLNLASRICARMRCRRNRFSPDVRR